MAGKSRPRIFNGPGTYTEYDLEFADGEGFTCGYLYETNISVWRVGYEAGWTDSIQFAVVDQEQVLSLPGGLQKFSEEAFAGTRAQLIVVPDGTQTIGRRAFAGCEKLIAVSVPEGAEMEGSALEGCNPLLVVERR